MKIGNTWEIPDCNKKIMDLISGVLPDPSLFPDTKISLFIRDITLAGKKDGIEWAVQFTQPVEEFSLLVMNSSEIKHEKRDSILIIGDERIPNGLYLLYSRLWESILKVKFHTKEEALLYASMYKIKHFQPFHMTKSFSSYPWYDGSETMPDIYGYQKASLSVKD